MENNSPQTSSSRSNIVPIAITIAVVVIILAGAVMFATSRQNDQAASVTPTQSQTTQVSPTQEAVMAARYRNGQYKAIGEYTSPGGAESIDVTLTLQDDVVTEADVVSKAFRPTSKQMQASFISGYKEQVVGKKIDEINLTKVAKSSLAPKGFNDAVTKIKAQAQS